MCAHSCLLCKDNYWITKRKRHKKHIPPASIPKRFLLPPAEVLLLLSLNKLQVHIFILDPAGLEASRIKDFCLNNFSD